MISLIASEVVYAALISAIASIFAVVLLALVFPLTIRKLNRHQEERAKLVAFQATEAAKLVADSLLEQIRPNNGNTLGQVADITLDTLHEHGQRLGRIEYNQTSLMGDMTELRSGQKDIKFDLRNHQTEYVHERRLVPEDKEGR